MSDHGARPIFEVFVREPSADSSAVVELRGELDLAGRPALTRALQPVVARAPERLVLELADLCFIDGSGLSVLIEAARSIGRDGGTVVLRDVPHLLGVLLDATATRPMFDIEQLEPS